jgi:hypothetical protein
MESLQQDQTCRICGTQVKAPTARKYDDTHSVQCWTCGDYEIRPEAYLLLFSVYAEQKRYLLSGRVICPGFLDHLQVEEFAASCPLSVLTELAYSTGVRFRIEECGLFSL